MTRDDGRDLIDRDARAAREIGEGRAVAEHTGNRILTGKSALFVVDRTEQLFAGRQPTGGGAPTVGKWVT